jgi:hypothetical protein
VVAKVRSDLILRQLANHGAGRWEVYDDLARFLKEALKKSLPPEMARLVGSIEQDASKLKSMLEVAR